MCREKRKKYEICFGNFDKTVFSGDLVINGFGYLVKFSNELNRTPQVVNNSKE